MSWRVGTIIPKYRPDGRLEVAPDGWSEIREVIEARFGARMYLSESDNGGTFLGRPCESPCYLLGIEGDDDTNPNMVINAVVPVLDRLIARNTSHSTESA